MIAASISLCLLVVVIVIAVVCFARASALEEDATDDKIDFNLEDWRGPFL